MRNKHVEQDPDEFRVEFKSAEVSEHVEDDSGMARDPIATGHNTDPTGTGNGSNRENVDPKESLESTARLGRKRVLVPPENTRRGKVLRIRPRQSQRLLTNKEGLAPD